MKRYAFIDALRGLTVALMVIVNSPGNNHPFQTLAHANWNGCTLADLVFPFFIILVGISATLAISSKKAQGIKTHIIMTQVTKRTLLILSLGLLLNAIPSHFSFESIRYFGVLQRIAICFFFTAVCALTLNRKGHILLFLSLLLLYEGLLAAQTPLHLLSVDNNLVGTIDRFFFTGNHLYLKTFDPEGLLSTIGAFSTVLLGNLLAFSLLSRQHMPGYTQAPWRHYLKQLCLTAICFVVLGACWNLSFPINKALWSSAYVLWSGGLFILFFVIIYYLFEIKATTKLAKPFVFLGQHALFIYYLHVLLLKAQAFTHLINHNSEPTNLRLYIGETLFGQFTPPIGALLYSVFFLLICSLFTLGYSNLHCYLKVSCCNNKR